MASNPYVNKVVYGNQTLLDLTDDTVAPEVLLQGYKAHDKSGIEIFGSYTPITPEIITPSNSSPVSLVADHVYKPSDSGYAIASYSNITPSASGTYFSSGFKKMASSGYAYSAQFPALGGTPDKSYTNASMSNNATASITVTKKPRYIVMSVSSTTSAGSFLAGLYDIENNTAYRYSYWSSAWQNGTWSNVSNYITSVSSSSVGIKNSWGGTARIAVGCYY